MAVNNKLKVLYLKHGSAHLCVTRSRVLSNLSISQNHVLSLSENAVATDVVRESLSKLLKARFVERCPAPEAVISKPVDEEKNTRKRGAKSAKVIVYFNACCLECIQLNF